MAVFDAAKEGYMLAAFQQPEPPAVGTKMP